MLTYQHGVSGGYYLTFLLGGFMTTVSRLSRANIRPLLLPAEGLPPSLAKHLYDIAGTIITVLSVNYICAPFMLLTIRDSLQAWSVLKWYGFWIIFGGLAFFYAGGRRILKSFHPKVAKGAEKLKEEPKPRAERGIPVPLDPMTPGFVPPVDSVAKEFEKNW